MDRYLPDEDVIGVVSSPNTTDDFKIDILEDSITSPLQGKVLWFTHNEGAERKLVLVQIIDLKSVNTWHQKQTLKSVIKRKGALEYLSGEGDTKTASLMKIGAFSFNSQEDKFETTTLNTPPASGIDVHETSNTLMKKLVEDESGIFYLGRIYGSDTAAPFSLKHFGDVTEGGFGEAHRIGIFGKSGSGKTVFGATMIGGFARNEEMGILLLDPQGQFGGDRFGNANFHFSFEELIDKMRGGYINKGISEIALRNRGTFTTLLVNSGVLKEAGYTASRKQNEAAERLEHRMERSSTSPHSLSFNEFSNHLVEMVETVYSSKDEDEIESNVESNQALMKHKFHQVRALFEEGGSEGRISVDNLIDKVLSDSEIVILDLDPVKSGLSMLDERVKDRILHGILSRLQYRYRSNFRAGETSNAMVVLDEAHNYLKRGKQIDRTIVENIKQKIITAQFESRKFGIGWLFINQRTANFDQSVLSQLEDHVFCSGLDVGSDKTIVSDLVGSEMFNEYRTLPNPNQSDIYTYMISGSIISVGTTGRPMFIEAFDNIDEILEENR